MSEQKRSHKILPRIGVFWTLLVCLVMPSPVLADDDDNEAIAGAYLVEHRIEGPENCCPVEGFRSVMMLTKDGLVGNEFDVAPPQQDNSSGFGVWKRIDDGDDDEAPWVKIRYLSFTGNEIPMLPMVLDGDPVTTFRVTYTVDFDPDFPGFEGQWSAPIFCSNEAACGSVQDPLLDPDDAALIVIFGTVTARQISIPEIDDDDDDD